MKRIINFSTPASLSLRGATTLTRSLSLSKCNPLLKPLSIIFVIALFAIAPAFQAQAQGVTFTTNLADSYTVTAGGNITLTIVATFPPSAIQSYEWYVIYTSGLSGPVSNNAVCSGQGSPSLTLTNVPASYNGNKYYCKVSGGVNSNTATLTVAPITVTGITITKQPDLVYLEGISLNLNGLVVELTYSNGTKEDVEAFNFAAKEITTYINSVAVDGISSGTVLSIAAHNGQRITVTCNGHSAYTNQLTVVAPPTFNPHPVSQSVAAGGTVAFTAAATASTGTLFYRWEVSPKGGANWVNVHDLLPSGSFSVNQSSTLTLTNVPASLDGYRFRCNVDNWIGSAGYNYYSNPATLTVTSASAVTYAVTVNGGTGSGSYAASATVYITADAPAAGKEFDVWTTTSAGVSFADATAASTSFTMPANAVAVAATYRDDPTGNEQLTQDAGQLKAYAANGMLYVSGLQEGATLRVYNLVGALVYHGIAANAETQRQTGEDLSPVAKSQHHLSS